MAINANQLNLLRLQMAQQHTTPVQQALQHQQHHTAAQQIIIPSQLLAAQQLLQFQTSNQQHQHQQPGATLPQNGIYGNINQVTTQMISNAVSGNTDRGVGQVGNGNNQNTTGGTLTAPTAGYRSNC